MKISFLDSFGNLKLIHKFSFNKINISFYAKVASVFRILNLNKCQNSLGVKTRSEVSGTGKKPWNQKGTGRARHGSKRSPIWVKGGVSHGPDSNKNYFKKINKKLKANVFRDLILFKILNKSLTVLKCIQFFKNSSSYSLSWLKKIKSKRSNNIIVIDHELPDNLFLSFRNSNFIKFKTLKSLNLTDLIKADQVIISFSSFKILIKSKSIV
ncbi:MAG: 50S ribosomal protein L4 [Candidatus Organicella extenuata]|uniref:Large ribosomal subunit protein uL4 n=1 Tax=Candidatus Organicella extenuata TaxID=2841811 RepID=A0AA51BKD4_9BACT|nr:MAG: 50S ribosomal protein L4 [Candidatus Organicella extenuata]